MPALSTSPPGDYSAQIVVSATGYTPVTVPVSLTVLPVPAPSTVARLSRHHVAQWGRCCRTGRHPHDRLGRWTCPRPALRLRILELAALQRALRLHRRRWQVRSLLPPSPSTPIPASPAPSAAPSHWQTTNNSVTVPVTLDATPLATKPAQIAAVVNAASGLPDALAPGEIFSIFGLGVGGTVFVNGVPAPLLYTSSGQVNAVVPYEAGASGIAKVKVVAAGVSSGEWGIPLAAAAPAIFTLNASGAGRARSSIRIPR